MGIHDKNPAYFYLSVSDDGVKVQHLGQVFTIHSVNELTMHLAQACMLYDIEPEDQIVMCSSSLDFPDEYTDKPEVIELCQRIRS